MTATAPSSHIRKRPFQPSITSFFNRDENCNRTQKLTLPLSPPLPAETQASLLSVGMRVRKSVPEGYKTHKTLGAQGFPFPSTAPPTTTTTTPPRPVYSSQVTRELTPFCGLHKVGGMAEQPPSYAPPSSAPAAFFGHDCDETSDMPALSMSQNTIQSTQGSFMSMAQSRPTKKRAFEEEVEDDLDDYFHEVEAADAMMDRPIAQAKSALRQPNKQPYVFSSGPDDFEEAAFLAPAEGMDLDRYRF